MGGSSGKAMGLACRMNFGDRRLGFGAATGASFGLRGYFPTSRLMKLMLRLLAAPMHALRVTGLPAISLMRQAHLRADHLSAIASRKAISAMGLSQMDGLWFIVALHHKT